jgi:hypothetical protein
MLSAVAATKARATIFTNMHQREDVPRTNRPQLPACIRPIGRSALSTSSEDTRSAGWSNPIFATPTMFCPAPSSLRFRWYGHCLFMAGAMIQAKRPLLNRSRGFVYDLRGRLARNSEEVTAWQAKSAPRSAGGGSRLQGGRDRHDAARLCRTFGRQVRSLVPARLPTGFSHFREEAELGGRAAEPAGNSRTLLGPVGIHNWNGCDSSCGWTTMC